MPPPCWSKLNDVENNRQQKKNNSLMTHLTRSLLLTGLVVLPLAWYASRHLDPLPSEPRQDRRTTITNCVLRAVVGAQRIVEVSPAPRPADAAASDEHYCVSVDYMNSIGGIERTNLAVVLFPVATSGGDVWAAIAR